MGMQNEPGQKHSDGEEGFAAEATSRLDGMSGERGHRAGRA